MGPGAAPALVTRDFTSMRGVVPGSVRVLDGEVVALGAHRVVLRLVALARLEYGLR